MFEQASCVPAIACMGGLEVIVNLVLWASLLGPAIYVSLAIHKAMWAHRDRMDAAKRSVSSEVTALRHN